jgi:hypothetical protein
LALATTIATVTLKQPLLNQAEFLTDSNGTEERNPCLKVGDLLIALESVGVGSFYTMNAKESKQLCPVLGQELVIRPMRADSDDVIYRAVPPQSGIP